VLRIAVNPCAGITGSVDVHRGRIEA